MKYIEYTDKSGFVTRLLVTKDDINALASDYANDMQDASHWKLIDDTKSLPKTMEQKAIESIVAINQWIVQTELDKAMEKIN